ncbi:hypothetical protein RHMOL_Rhmol10G0072900 [Rhododendron molle]|uniref:Uncharacterized protein n=1 Tax=Rhododendron molle TaxID=49168 RepID=A0ACC0M0W0_RHOML|nr:hypothetical protein RHMOL_Rhmol10G0072900 [Rhododendron molle]
MSGCLCCQKSQRHPHFAVAFCELNVFGAKREPQPLEDIVSKFCEGSVIFGPYFDHVLGYQKVSLERPEKFFFITYEELKNDPNIHVKRLAEFLGCPFVGEDTEEQVEEVVRSCSIETLKKHEKESLERPKKSDPITQDKRLAEFLGCLFVGEEMEKQVEDVEKSCSVETLKKYEVNNSSDVPIWSNVSYKSFLRKGQVGDHMNYLTKGMIERIDAITR